MWCMTSTPTPKSPGVENACREDFDEGPLQSLRLLTQRACAVFLHSFSIQLRHHLDAVHDGRFKVLQLQITTTLPCTFPAHAYEGREVRHICYLSEFGRLARETRQTQRCREHLQARMCSLR